MKSPAASRPGSGPIEVLAPNGDRLPFFPGRPVGLGAALHITEPHQLLDSRVLHDASADSPWAPIAVTKSDATGFSALVGAWRASAPLARLIVLPTTPPASPHDALHLALRSPGAPTADEAAAWVKLRAPSSRLAET